MAAWPPKPNIWQTITSAAPAQSLLTTSLYPGQPPLRSADRAALRAAGRIQQLLCRADAAPPQHPDLTVPDFKNRDLMSAAYECSVCGLRDRAQIDAALHSSDYLTPETMGSPTYGLNCCLAFAVVVRAVSSKCDTQCSAKNCGRE